MSARAITRQERDELVLSLLPKVRLAASFLRRKLYSREPVEDLVSIGTLGLISAIDRFDPDRGVKLATFVDRRISGAILDFVRKTNGYRRKQMSGNPTPISLDSLKKFTKEFGVCPDFELLHEDEDELCLKWLRDSVKKLPCAERDVVRLLASGLTAKDVAAKIGLSTCRVYQIRIRAISHLQEIWRRQHEFGRP